MKSHWCAFCPDSGGELKKRKVLIKEENWCWDFFVLYFDMNTTRTVTGMFQP